MSTATIETTVTHDNLIPAIIPQGRGMGRSTDKIKLNTATGQFHCSFCDYVAPKYGSVFSHLSSHTPRAPKSKSKSSVTSYAESGYPSMPLDQKLHLAAHLIADVDLELSESHKDMVDASWKARALAAERSLKSLRKILGAAA